MGEKIIPSIDDPVLAEFHRQVMAGRLMSRQAKKYSADAEVVKRSLYSELHLHKRYAKLQKPNNTNSSNAKTDYNRKDA